MNLICCSLLNSNSFFSPDVALGPFLPKKKAKGIHSSQVLDLYII